MTEEERQEHVVHLVEGIHAVISGEEIALACTALTIAVAAVIINTSKGEKDRLVQSREFAQQLEDYALRGDIVEWIKANTTYVSSVSGSKQ